MHSRKAVLAMVLALAAAKAPAALAQGTVHDDATLHPAWTLSELHPPAWEPQVSHMDFLADGSLVVLTHAPARENTTGIPKPSGTLNIVSNLGGTPEAITYKQVAMNLLEPMGVLVLNGKIYIAEKTQLTEHTLSADGATTTRKVGDIPVDTAGSVNFQEYPFGLLHKDGFFYTASSGAVRIGGVSFSTAPAGLKEAKRAGILRINAATGASEIINGGLRAPNGLIWGPEGSMWITDNQGSFVPSSKLIHVEAGRNYGYYCAPNPFSAQPETWPAVWFVHAEIGRSPTHPVFIRNGLYKDQLLVGDLSQGGVMRAFLEKVNGAWQGSAFSFSGGFSAGIQKILELPDGSLVLGGLGRGDTQNWGWKAKTRGLQKLSPKPGIVAFEMLAVRSRSDGMEIEFTKPVGAEATLAANYEVVTGGMKAGPLYNEGNMINRKTLAVSAVLFSQDRKSAFLRIEGLEARTVVIIKPKGVKSVAGEDLYRPTAWYTLTSISPSSAFSGLVSIAKSGRAAPGLKVGMTGRGLSVQVPFAGAHVLTVRSLQGATLTVRRDAGPMDHVLDLGPISPGVYLIEVTAGSRRAVQPVAL